MGMAKKSNNQGIDEDSSFALHETEGDDAANQGLELSKVERIWQVVASIPSGRVASYGQIAALAGLPGYARFVGTTLGKLPRGTALPWHRVVNASLQIAPRNSKRMLEQKHRLRNEGVIFKGNRVVSTFRLEP
jgi:methylated-DNA-protein-cysteine methyltransferase-like protein